MIENVMNRLLANLRTLTWREIGEDVASIVMLGLWIWWMPDLLAVLIAVTQP